MENSWTQDDGCSQKLSDGLFPVSVHTATMSLPRTTASTSDLDPSLCVDVAATLKALRYVSYSRGAPARLVGAEVVPRTRRMTSISSGMSVARASVTIFGS